MTADPNGRPMKELPRPSIDMCDGAASEWLHQLEDHYTGYAARYIRDLADRLQRQHAATIKAQAEERIAEAKRKIEELADLESRSDEIASERRELDDQQDDLDDEERAVDRKLTELRRAT